MGAVIGRTSVAAPHASPAQKAETSVRESKALRVRIRERKRSGTRNASEAAVTAERFAQLG
jgi:hypothetical protein